MDYWIVEKSNYDSTRPYAVVASFRSFNRVIGRYPTEAAAKRRARDLNAIQAPRKPRVDHRYQRAVIYSDRIV